MVKGAIFDLDGTLLDSMWVWHEVDTRFLLNHGLPVKEEYLTALKSMNFAQCAAFTREYYGVSLSDEEMYTEWDFLARKAYADEVTVKEGALEFLENLKSKGVRLGIATSSYESLFAPTFARCGLDGIFEHITTKDEVKCGKERADIFLRAAEKMGLAPAECAVFEDILLAVNTCRRAGFYTVGVADVHAAHDADAIRAAADMYIDTFNDPTLYSIFEV